MRILWRSPGIVTCSIRARSSLLPLALKPPALSFLQDPIYRKPLVKTGRAFAPLDPSIISRFLQLRLLKLLEPFGEDAEAGEEGGGNADGVVPEFLLGAAGKTGTQAD